MLVGYTETVMRARTRAKKFAEPNEIHIRPQASISGPCQTLAHYISETFILVYPGGGFESRTSRKKGRRRRRSESEGERGREDPSFPRIVELIDLVRRYAGIFRSDQLRASSGIFIPRQFPTIDLSEFEYASSRPNIVSAIRGFVKAGQKNYGYFRIYRLSSLLTFRSWS